MKIAVAVGRSAEARAWKNRTFVWSEFVSKLRKPHTTHETYAEYLKMTKAEQAKIKDVGGYVCGYLNGGRRAKANVMYRSALTLDLDFAPYDFWGAFTLLWGCAAVLHSTHKHCPDAPRYRLIVPLDRDVTPDEYVAIARKLAASVGIDYFDPTTFDTNRLMFWPSVASDGEYVFEEQRGEALTADEVLSSYRNWRDISEWAFGSKVAERVHEERGKKQQDPLSKNNIVGHFCNAYDIHTAIAEFLPDVYEPADDNGRYTYAQGSTACGLVVYDDLFAFSHHGTDPASGALCNAFDLVRIHKFGTVDEGDNTTKSYKLMCEFCRTLAPVKREIARSVIRDYDEFTEQTPDFKNDPYEKVSTPAPSRSRERAEAEPTAESEADDSWKERLDVDKNNKYENTANNVTLILRHDPKLSGRMRLDLFSGKKFTVDKFPWHVDAATYPRAMRDVDFAGLRNYVERVYGITSPQKIDDAVALELNRNSFHPVRDYFDGLEWDGVPRIDTLLIECFNATDNHYTREVSRKWLVAAVARVYNPGCKYDTILSLVGEEGTRKSTFLRKLGMDWFSDSFMTVTGKESFEQILGKLIVEIAEMSAFDKAESVQIKHYASKQVDSFRPAYGRETVDYPRQCVFAATSNNRTFLRDADGNRRFWPIDVHLPAKSAGNLDPASSDFDKLVPQIWAEAVTVWRLGESLTLSAAAEALADIERSEHAEVDDRLGVIEEYVNTEVPEGWQNMPPAVRADYFADPSMFSGRKCKRRHISVIEVWCECFGRRKEQLTQRDSREINNLLKRLRGWKARAGLRMLEHYGRQRYYERSNP